MTKAEIIEELERIDCLIKELRSEHDYYCTLLDEVEEGKEN